METIFEKRYCKELKYIGRYETDWLLSYNIQREWALQREKIKYNVEIMTVMNRKSIIITMSAPVLLSKVHELLCKILRYECLFDGRFFKMQKYEIDNLDITAEMRKSMLSYYEGEKAYTKFSQPMNDTIYKRGFCAWERFNKKLLSMNQMFYYIGFGNGITADLRLALFAEIFEPLSEHLEYFQKVQINCSQQSRQRNARCPKCDFEFKIPTQNRPSLRDKIESVIRAYGLRIFDGDDVLKILKKTVNTRNKMLHVKIKKDILTGGQCGFYIRKYVELYRIAILSELKLWNSDMGNDLMNAIERYNSEFPKLRIKQKRNKKYR